MDDDERQLGSPHGIRAREREQISGARAVGGQDEICVLESPRDLGLHRSARRAAPSTDVHCGADDAGERGERDQGEPELASVAGAVAANAAGSPIVEASTDGAGVAVAGPSRRAKKASFSSSTFRNRGEGSRARVEVTRGARGDAVAADLHLPEERLAEANGGRFVRDEVAQVRRPRHGGALAGMVIVFCLTTPRFSAGRGEGLRSHRNEAQRARSQRQRRIASGGHARPTREQRTTGPLEGNAREGPAGTTASQRRITPSCLFRGARLPLRGGGSGASGRSLRLPSRGSSPSRSSRPTPR